jgi:cellulose synthase/poly-beta-1,6-N-acetylglucosamine synthase-like glycosyltransferase
LLLYALYWVFRTAFYLIRLLTCFFHVVKDTEIDWLARCRRLDRPEDALNALIAEQADWWKARGLPAAPLRFGDRVRRRLYLYRIFVTDRDAFRGFMARREEIHAVGQYLAAADRPDAARLVHLVIIPTYKEGMKILRPTMEHLIAVNYPLDRLHIVIAGEAADDTFDAVYAELHGAYAEKLPHLYASRHPLAPGELAGKSSNQAYAIKWFDREVLSRHPIPKDRLLVTSLDADYRVHPEYFATLSYKYAVDPERAYHIYQPIPMFFNNIWRVNVFSRILATLGTQIQMARQLDYRENRNFSSYALAFATAEGAGYWDVDVIQEDSRLFWKVYFRFGEKVRVEPLFLPVFGDAVHSATYLKSVVSLYEQMRRWAWGASDVPYVIVRAFQHPEISLGSRLRAVVDVITNYFNWATMPVILAVGTFFPFYLNPEFSDTVIGYNLPVFTSRLLTLTSGGLVIFLIVDAMLAPAKPKEWQPWRRMMVYLQWLIMPLLGIFFSALPAIDAQTRLMIKGELEYKVTEKES